MAKKSKEVPSETPSQLRYPIEKALVLPDTSSRQLVEDITKDPSRFADETLGVVFSSVHTVQGRMTKFLEVIKTEFKRRRQSWETCGDRNQHRKLEVKTEYGDVTVECQTREGKLTLNVVAAEEFLRKKKLWDDVYDLVIESGADELQKFLKKNRKEVKQMGLEVREVLNEDKLAALVTQQKITPLEFKELHTQADPTYAITLAKALDLDKVKKLKA